MLLRRMRRAQNEKRIAYYYFHLPSRSLPPPAQGQAHTGLSPISGGQQPGLHVHSHLSFAAGRLWLLGIHSLIYPIELWVLVENSPGVAAIHQYSLQSPDSCSLWAASTRADLIFSHRAEEDLGKISYIRDSPKHSVYL